MHSVYPGFLRFLFGSLTRGLAFLPVVGFAGLALTFLAMLGIALSLDMSWLTAQLPELESLSISFNQADIWRWYLRGSLVFGVVGELLERLRGSDEIGWPVRWQHVLSVMTVLLFLIFLLIPFQPLAADATVSGLYIAVTVLALSILAATFFYLAVLRVGDYIFRIITSEK